MTPVEPIEELSALRDLAETWGEQWIVDGLDAIRDELAELRKDKARLDWMEVRANRVHMALSRTLPARVDVMGHTFYGDSIREAVDAATTWEAHQ